MALSDPNGMDDSDSVVTTPNPKDNYDYWNGDLSGFLKWKAENGTDADYDRWITYLMSENSLQKGRDWTSQREDTQYQRLVADLKAAGINPYALLQNGASPVSSSSSGNSYSGSYKANESLKQEQNDTKWASLLITFLTTVVMAAAIAA